MKMAATITREIAAEITRRSGECFFFSFAFGASAITTGASAIHRMLADIALRRIPHQSDASTTSGRAFAPSSR